MVVSREMGMKTGRTKEVEGEDCLRKEVRPLLYGEPGVEGRKSSDEVVLERLDGTFGGVGAVDVGWSKLDGE